MGFLVHERRKNFDIRILELFQFAVFQNRFDESGFTFGKFELVEQAVENRAVRASTGRRLLQDLQSQIVIENFGELLRGSDVERIPPESS